MARISRKGSGPGLQAFNRKFRFSEFGIRAETGAPKAFGAPARLKLEKLIWLYFQPQGLPEGFASGNGRIEATEVDVVTKLTGPFAQRPRRTEVRPIFGRLAISRLLVPRLG